MDKQKPPATPGAQPSQPAEESFTLEDLEQEFVTAYNNYHRHRNRAMKQRQEKQETVVSWCKDAINKCVKDMKMCTKLDDKYLIYELETCALPEFVKEPISNEARRFYEVSLRYGMFLVYLLAWWRSREAAGQEEVAKEDQDFLEGLEKNPELKDEARHGFVCLIRAAIDMQRCPMDEVWREAVDFLDAYVLKQKLLYNRRVCNIFLELIGTVFVMEWTRVNSTKLSRLDNPSNVGLVNVMTKVATLYHAPPQKMSMLDVLAASSWWDNFTEFMPKFERGKKFYCAFMNMLSSFATNSTFATKIAQKFFVPKTDDIPFSISKFCDRFNQASTAHFKSEKRNKLRKKDAMRFESEILLLSQLYKMESTRMIIEKSPNDKEIQGLHRNLVICISSAVPCSLKASCFELLGAMRQSMWGSFRKLVTSEMIDAFESNSLQVNILGDIQDTERGAKVFFLPAAMAHFIQSQLENKYTCYPKIFEICHKLLGTFLSYLVKGEQTEQNSKVAWEFKFKEQKWKILRAICDAWITSCTQCNEECFHIVLRSVVSGEIVDGIMNNLLTLILESDIPLDAILSIVRFLLVLCKKTAQKNSDRELARQQGTMLSYSALINQISKSAVGANILQDNHMDILTKLLGCIACPLPELQIQCIELLKHLSTASPIIVQVLAKPDAIKILQLVIDDKGSEATRVKYELMRFLLKLGPTSYFVRHVSGFDLDDPPKSISESNLRNGIYPNLVNELMCRSKGQQQKMYNKQAPGKPRFASSALKVILAMCGNQLTAAPVLKFLRDRQFLDYYYELPRTTNVGSDVIGYFLQLLAREVSDPSEDAFNASTIDPLFKRANVTEYTKRTILLFEFIDRIGSDEDSVQIAKGLRDIVIACLNDSHTVAMMKEQPAEFNAVWLEAISNILDRICAVTNAATTESLAETVAVIARFIIADKLIGVVDGFEVKLIYTKALHTLNHLLETGHGHCRAGIYSLLTAIFKTVELSPEFAEITADFSPMILAAATQDIVNQLPITRMLVMSFMEAIVACRRMSHNERFRMFIDRVVDEIGNDWLLYETDQQPGLMCLAAKCSFLTRFITTSTNPMRECRFLLDRNVIARLSRPSFWKALIEAFTAKLHEYKYDEGTWRLETAGKICRLITTIALVFSGSESLEIQVNRFLTDFRDSFASILEKGRHRENVVTCESASFLADFTALLASIQNTENLKGAKIWDQIPRLFKRFVESDDWKDGVVEVESASKSVDRMLRQLCFVLMKMSEKEDVFAGPLVTQSYFSAKKRSTEVQLTLVTTYLRRLIDGTRTEDQWLRATVSALLLIIWRHVERWERGTADVELERVKRETLADFRPDQKFSKMQKEELSIFSSMPTEQILLTQLCQFAE